MPTAPSLRRSHFGRDFEGELGVQRPSEADIAAARANADDTFQLVCPPELKYESWPFWNPSLREAAPGGEPRGALYIFKCGSLTGT